MGKQIFIPLTDEILYEHPERITGPLTPYRTDLSCHHWLSVELNPEDDKQRSGIDYHGEFRIPKRQKLQFPAWLTLQGVRT